MNEVPMYVRFDHSIMKAFFMWGCTNPDIMRQILKVCVLGACARAANLSDPPLQISSRRKFTSL